MLEIPFDESSLDDSVDVLVVRTLKKIRSDHAARLAKMIETHETESKKVNYPGECCLRPTVLQLAKACEKLAYIVQNLETKCKDLAVQLNAPGPTLLELSESPNPQHVLVDNVPMRLLSIQGCKLRRKRERKRYVVY